MRTFRPTVLQLTVLGLALAPAGVSADHDAGKRLRDHRRYEEKRVEAEHDRQRDILKHEKDRSEKELKCWRDRERDRLKFEYETARHHRGVSKSGAARRYLDERRRLDAEYRHRREELDDFYDHRKDAIDDHYDRLEDAVEDAHDWRTRRFRRDTLPRGPIGPGVRPGWGYHVDPRSPANRGLSLNVGGGTLPF